MNITIEVLSSIEFCLGLSSCASMEELCAQLAKLYAELSSKSLPPTKTTLECFFAHGGYLVAALDKDKNVVGMGMLVFTYKANETRARVEDVVVLRAWQRQGIARKIMDTLIELALNHQVRHVDLTSHPGRFAANTLYEELGFIKLDTNVRRFARIRD